MRAHWHRPRTQLSVLKTSGLKLILCSPNLLASARITHPLFCVGRFVPLDVSYPPPTHREHLLLLHLVPHNIIVIIQLIWPWNLQENLVMLFLKFCKSLSRVSPHSRYHSDVHGQGDSHKPCGSFPIVTLPRRSQGAGNSFQILQCSALRRLMCGIFVLHHKRALEMGQEWAGLSSWVDIQQLFILFLLGLSWQRGHQLC